MITKSIYFLVGFMGSGKSLLGRRAATQLNYDFIEMDEEIEAKAGKPIRLIFQEEGETYFRKLEQSVLLEIIEKHQHEKKTILVSTGGGTPCFFDNMEQMLSSGHVVYINPSVEILFQRLKSGRAERPLLKNKSDEELKSYISSTLAQRNPIYQQAEWIVNPILESKEANAQLLINLIEAAS